MCGKNHTHDSLGIHCQFPHMFGFYHKHGNFGNHLRTPLKTHSKQMQPIWGHIWKHTAGKSQTNATYDVILHPFTQAIWRYISKHIAGKSQTNATLYGLRGHIWKCTAEQKSNKCNYCNYASSHAHVLRSHTKKMWWEKSQKNLKQMFFPHMCGKLHIQPEDNLCGFYHTCVLFHTYVWK